MDTPFIGQIQYFGFNFAPRGWALCEGQLLSIASYTALFSLLGTTFGGDGRTTFGLPDLRGRAPIGPGSGPGLGTVNWGQKAGTEQVTLSTLQLPAHTHAYQKANRTNEAGDSTDPTTGALAASGRFDNDYLTGDTESFVQTTSSGASQPVNIRNPFLGVYASIALVGLYPSRN